MREGILLASAVCPKCGFDLEDGKACRVCGYAPASPARIHDRLPPPVRASAPRVSPAPAAATSRTRRQGAQGPLIMLASAVVGLLAVVGVFILGDLRSRAGQDSTAAVTVSAPSPAPEAALAPLAAAPAPAPAALAGPPVAPGTAPAQSIDPPVARTSIPLGVSEPPFDITSRRENPPTNSRSAYVAWMLAHYDEKQKFLEQKWALARSMIALRSLSHPRVLAAILSAPREFFCRDARRAYEDAVLPIGYGQTISGPHMVARMTDYLDPQPEQKVLEIGTGSGYQSAVLSELSNHVYTIEIVEPLARETDKIYQAREAHYPEYRNVHRRIADGYYGWPEHAPFDRIIVTCGIDHVPPELLRELAPEGIMVIPVGPPSGQTILRIIKHVSADGTVTLDREDIFHGKKRQIFVPFRSGQGGIHVFEDKKETK